MTNHSNSITFTYIPYTNIPVNLDTCPTEDGSLITPCDVVPGLAKEITNAVNDTLNCHSSPMPTCARIICDLVDTHDNLSLTFLPCHTPPAILLTNVHYNGTVTLNRTLVNTTNGISALIGQNPATINITIVQHKQRLTLGLEVSESIRIQPLSCGMNP
jgi:hypothetical protein